MFSNILAEVKGEKAPTRKKNTPRVKSVTARKRAIVKNTSTAPPVPAITQHIVAQHATPIAQAHSSESPIELSKSPYNTMKQQELLNKVRLRELEVKHKDTKYLANLLVISDEAYEEIIGYLGCTLRAMDFARDAVKLYNKELKRKEAALEVAHQQASHQVNKKRKRDERVKAEKSACKKRHVEKNATPVSQRSRQPGANKTLSVDSKHIDMRSSGASSHPARTKAVKKTALKITRANTPIEGGSQTGRRRTRRSRVIEEPEDKNMPDEDMKHTGDQGEDKQRMSAFIVDDMPSKPKGKKKVVGMARSRLFAGF
jgi:hypothetical protein